MTLENIRRISSPREYEFADEEGDEDGVVGLEYFQENDYHGQLKLECRKGEGLYQMKSKYGRYKYDRRFRFKCGLVSSEICC